MHLEENMEKTYKLMHVQVVSHVFLEPIKPVNVKKNLA